jgi:hypothetical protein
MPQKIRTLKIAAIAIALTLFAISPVSAQNGEPIISTGSVPSGTLASTASIDAYVATSTYTPANDVCLRIQYVYNSVLPSGSSATVDARGFTTNNAPSGGWVCSVNPFATTSGSGLVGKAGKLLLGYIDIPAAVTWVIPTRIIIEGIGGNGTGLAGANTMIHAASTFGAGLGTTTAVLQMGLGGTSGTDAAVSFGIQIRNLSVDCNATSSGSGARSAF